MTRHGLAETLRARRWSPYAVGAGLGVLSWFSFFSADHGLGVTGAFEQAAAKAVTPILAPAHAYVVAPGKAPTFGWEMALVVGTFLGAFVSARLSRSGSSEVVPDLWRARFGAAAPPRLLAAFMGGAVMMFGARLAEGCTSGHGITGVLQFAASSWLFVAVMFGVAVAVTTALFRTGRTRRAR